MPLANKPTPTKGTCSPKSRHSIKIIRTEDLYVKRKGTLMPYKYTPAYYLIEFAFLFYHILTPLASIFYILYNFNDYTHTFND